MDKYEIYIAPNEKAVGQLKVRRLIDGLDESKGWDVKISRHREKRSLTSNGYAWKLLDLIASKLHESKEAVYRGYIKEIGGNSDVFVMKSEAVERFIQTWSGNGIGYVCDVLTEYENEDGEEITEVMAYYGSHTYNQAQMNKLINLIVQDCITLGIPTKSQDEIDRLVSEWGGE